MAPVRLRIEPPAAMRAIKYRCTEPLPVWPRALGHRDVMRRGHERCVLRVRYLVRIERKGCNVADAANALLRLMGNLSRDPASRNTDRRIRRKRRARARGLRRRRARRQSQHRTSRQREVPHAIRMTRSAHETKRLRDRG